MIEDKLTHDERLRLECVNQSIQKNAGPFQKYAVTPEQILSDAREFEKFIIGTEEEKKEDKSNE